MTTREILNSRSYERGLYEVADGVFAYLQPDGSWGWSNAGLVRGNGASLLVDTLFDLPLTRTMLDSMAPVTSAAPIATLAITHANGDHWHGNQLVDAAEIIATQAAALEMQELPPSRMAAMMQADFGPEVNAFLRRIFAPFDFEGITATPANRTFTGRLELEVGGRRAELIELGPAHTKGDLVVHVPDAGIVYTGDLLFIHGTPIVWDGPYANCIGACDAILALGCEAVVPGHGPLTDASGVEACKRYFEFVHREASARHASGMALEDAVFDIDLGEFAELGDSERLAINVAAAYKELDPSWAVPARMELFGLMARLAK
ncbi:MAG: MBL fold metallo-hydrolase [Acidimicrobiales bacterium]